MNVIPEAVISVAKMPATTHPKRPAPSRGQVLKGQYLGAYRSEKGKIKGLWLRCGHQDVAICLPKYLRPMLVRELEPENYIQVWAYLEERLWRAVNILPLPPAEIEKLATDNNRVLENKPELRPPQRPQICIQVCRKGSCHKRGSGEVWRSLQQELEAHPDIQDFLVEPVGCMKACKRGPNLRLSPTGEMVHLARPQDVPALVAQLERKLNGRRST